MKLYMHRKIHLSIIRSLFTVHSAMVHVIQVCRQLWCRTRMELQFYPGPARKLYSVQWTNSWWLTDEMSETFRVSWQNKFVKLVHLVNFITKQWDLHSSGMLRKRRLAASYRRSGTTDLAHLQATAWHLKMGPIGSTEASVNNQSTLWKSQNSEYLWYCTRVLWRE